MSKISKIISGGQTGADRAALDFALENNIEIGGFIPKNRRAEDGRISEKYLNLTETETERLCGKNGIKCKKFGCNFASFARQIKRRLASNFEICRTIRKAFFAY